MRTHNDPPRTLPALQRQRIGIALHSETEEQMVVYRKLYGDGSLWVRPSAMFVEDVVVDGRTVPRFEWLE